MKNNILDRSIGEHHVTFFESKSLARLPGTEDGQRHVMKIPAHNAHGLGGEAPCRFGPTWACSVMIVYEKHRRTRYPTQVFVRSDRGLGSVSGTKVLYGCELIEIEHRCRAGRLRKVQFPWNPNGDRLD